MKTVLVTTDVPGQTGGIGTFVFNLTRLLRSIGEDVHVLLANPTEIPMKKWAPHFTEMGATVAAIPAESLDVPPGYTWYERTSEAVTALIPEDADIVYLPDSQARGFDFVRRRRYSGSRLPAIVTVLLRPSRWSREGNQILPTTEEELWVDFAESYSAAQSDYVVAPGQYMLDWVCRAGWKLPAEEHVRVLALPYFPREGYAREDRAAVEAAIRTAAQTASVATDGHSRDSRSSREAAVATLSNSKRSESARTVGGAERNGQADDVLIDDGVFLRLVFFGRLETRKGLELFIEALERLKDSPCMRTIDEIVFLGGPAQNSIGSPQEVVALAKKVVGQRVNVYSLSMLNSLQAQAYLAEHAEDTLVLVPSRRENFPFVVIETSLLPGVNLLCADTGSIPDILGSKGKDQLFEPFAAPFAKKLEQTLLCGPQPTENLGHYNWQSANEKWLDFHREVCVAVRRTRAVEVAANDVPASPFPAQTTVPAVDVCVSYYNLPSYLPYTLESLAAQTSKEFSVIVVNDGSTDPEAVRVFEAMKSKYQERGWRFVSTPNEGLSAARNAGAAKSNAEYLIFIDGDDVVAPNMVERFLTSIRRSGDDCLTSYFHLFKGEGWQPSYAHDGHYYYTPAGGSPLLGVISNPFGGACFIVRRSAFDRVGGFTTDVSKFVGSEDCEFLLRLALASMALDVLPEFLLYYRTRENSMFRTNNLYENKLRVLRVYEEHLRSVGLGGIAEFAAGVYTRTESERWHTSVESATDRGYMIKYVSGKLIVSVLWTKLRNQIALRLHLPLKLE
jgi:glycosyltransferase involved in cell wall biosynthesis